MVTEATSGQLAAQFDAWLALTAPAAARGRSERSDGCPAEADSGAVVRLPMLTGSMHPVLPRGCTLLIAPFRHGAATGADRPASRDAVVATGAVVVFARDGRLVAHRVLRRGRRDGQPWVLEMGDANRRGAWRPLGEAVGVVVGAEAADGARLPSPDSRARARRLLLRHWKATAGDLLRRDVTGETTDRETP